MGRLGWLLGENAAFAKQSGAGRGFGALKLVQGPEGSKESGLVCLALLGGVAVGSLRCPASPKHCA